MVTSFMTNVNGNPISNLLRLQVLDRPIGTPVLTAGVWSITNVDLTRVGWAPVASITNSLVPSAAIPFGASFFYVLPQNLLSVDPAVYNAVDNPGLTDQEKAQAKLLAQNLPPVPLDYNFLYANGVLMPSVNISSIVGIYAVTSYGLWWFPNADGQQPWSSELGGIGWVPANWANNKGTPRLRQLMDLQFSTSNLIQTN